MEIDPALNSDESVCIDNHESNSESIVQSQLPDADYITFHNGVLVEKAANSSFTLFEKWIVDVLLIRYNL